MRKLNIQNFSDRMFWKIDMIKQLQMSVSTIAIALVCTALQGYYRGNLRWKNGCDTW